MEKNKKKGKLVNCHLYMRITDEYLFYKTDDGVIVANLEEYTIIPNEEFAKLTNNKNEQ